VYKRAYKSSLETFNKLHDIIILFVKTGHGLDNNDGIPNGEIHTTLCL
jgi:hypothetical protein